MTKFVHLGCWNNLNKKKDKELGNLMQVMSKLKSYIAEEKNKKLDFLVLAGDNYYPGKTKTEGPVKKKEKIIYTKKLVDGFSSLPRGIEINMILGNHDLETNGTAKSLFINDTDHPEKSDCYILNNEMRYILNKNEKLRDNNLNFFLFKEKMLTNGTLLLMLDSSMYTTAASKYLQCYSVFLKRPVESQQSLMDIQNAFIKSTIEKYKSQIKHLVLIGHHPIIGIKNKSEKTPKTQKDKSAKDKSPKEKKAKEDKSAKKDKSAEVNDPLDDIPYFSDTLKMIYDILHSEVTYTYLCADLHLYQRGKVVMNTSMEINQYIVGTGGTELDDEIPQEVMDIKTFDRKGDGAVYELEECRHEFGFLECDIREDNGPVFSFISTKTSGGKQRTTKERKRTTKKGRKK